MAKFTSTGALAWVDVIRTENAAGDEGARAIQLDVTPSGDVFVFNDFGPRSGTIVRFLEGGSNVASQRVAQVGATSDLYVAKIDTLGRV